MRQPHCSGVLTISLVISRHDLQTDPQETTSRRAGHEASAASTLWIISRSNSGGMLAHWLCCWKSADEDGDPSGAICDLPRRFVCFPSALLLDEFPILSLMSLSSRTMLLKCIVTELVVSLPQNFTAEIKNTKWRNVNVMTTWFRNHRCACQNCTLF